MQYTPLGVVRRYSATSGTLMSGEGMAFRGAGDVAVAVPGVLNPQKAVAFLVAKKALPQ
jgi:hypothetical protein